jgi:hypothetical protein
MRSSYGSTVKSTTCGGPLTMKEKSLKSLSRRSEIARLR